MTPTKEKLPTQPALFMKLFRASFLALAPLLLAACGSFTPATASGGPGIVVGAGEIRECGQGRVQFPGGVYTAELVSTRGTYYLAPEPLKTLGVLLGRAERGGIYVSNGPGNPQSAWFGDLRDAATATKPSTLFEAVGAHSTRLWPYAPKIPFQVKK